MNDRRSSWRMLFRRHRGAFVGWLNATKTRQHLFENISACLEQFLLDALNRGDAYNAFANSIVPALRPRNMKIHDRPEFVLAYAYLYFLERYHRFWDVFLELFNAGILPMKRTGIDVLDVGSGPAPALYAVQDFYSAIKDFAKSNMIEELVTPEPTLEFVEENPCMCQFVHYFSEFCVRKGPYHPEFKDFKALNLREEQKFATEARIREIEHEDDTTWHCARRWVNENEQWWRDVFRYNLVIFSYFLTETNYVEKFTAELCSVFRALRPGGIVVIVGGTGPPYSDIHRSIDDLANKLGARRMIVDSIPCEYEDYHAKRIKELYTHIWKEISRRIDVTEYQKILSEADAPEVWNPQVGIKGPKRFGLRVYRKGNI